MSESKPIFPVAVIDRAFSKAAGSIRTINGLRHYVACRARLERYLSDEPTTTPTTACEQLADFVNKWDLKQAHRLPQ